MFNGRISLQLVDYAVAVLHRSLPTNSLYVNNNLGEDSSNPGNCSNGGDHQRGDAQSPTNMSPPLANTESKPTNTNNTLIQSRRIAIAVQGACKQYGGRKSSATVLENLNMTVPEGTIYSLLGASGCGKTTLLACCVGMRKLNRGNIFIFGHRPGTIESGVPGNRVGYMPQEIALYGEFKIIEAMEYFGRIYGMKLSAIHEKMYFLIKFLDLPDQTRYIRTLSGGQQRRVSFAIALLPDPEILILDEPTVGVDPLLRQNIWNHLCNLVSTGRTTVIITTHYIEEAKQATTIGLMRNGRLLAEDSPTNLLKINQCLNLEDVFLKLCMKDKTTNNTSVVEVLPNNVTSLSDTNGLNMISIHNERNRHRVPRGFIEEENGIVGLTFHQSKDYLVTDSHSESKSDPTMLNRVNKMAEDCSNCCQKPCCSFDPRKSLNRLKAMIIKNFICMWRNIGFMLFIFVLPSFQVILFCLAIGREPLDMKFGVVNNEFPGIGLCEPPVGCASVNLSCRYMDSLPKDSVTLIPYDTSEDALRQVHNGRIWGFMEFPANFSIYMVDRGITGNLAENATIYGSRIRIQMDMTNQQIAFSIQRILLDTFRSFSRQLLDNCDYDPTVGDIPIFFDTPVYGQDHPSFMEFMAPGIVLSIIFFMSVALTGSAFITERKEGMLERSLVAGVTTGEVITAHMITQYVIMVGQTTLVLIFMVVVFEVPVRGPLVWAVTLTLLQGTCGMAFGFLISTVCHDERNSIQLALGSFYPNLLLSGVVWPIESMPSILRKVSYILPETLACESMRSILTRGWGITHSAVWPGFLSSIIWSVVFWILAILVARFSRSK